MIPELQNRMSAERRATIRKIMKTNKLQMVKHSPARAGCKKWVWPGLTSFTCTYVAIALANQTGPSLSFKLFQLRTGGAHMKKSQCYPYRFAAKIVRLQRKVKAGVSADTSLNSENPQNLTPTLTNPESFKFLFAPF